MEPMNYDLFPCVVSQVSHLAHDELINADIDVQALLFIARNQAGSARIVSCWPPEFGQVRGDADARVLTTQDDDDDGRKPSSHPSMTDDVSSSSSLTTALNRVPDAKTNTAHVFRSPAAFQSARVPASLSRASHTPNDDVPVQNEGTPSGNSLEKLFDVRRASLAKLLAPANRETWNFQKLDLRLSGRCFVGCPVYCEPVQLMSKGLPEESPETEAGQHGRDENDFPRGQATSQSTKGSKRPAFYNHPQQSDQENFTIINLNDTAPCGPDHDHFGTMPTSPNSPPQNIPQIIQHASEGPEAHSFQSDVSALSLDSESDRRETSIVFYNVVAVLDCSVSKMRQQSEAYFKHIARPVSRRLRRIQKQQGWIDRQVRAMDYAYKSNASRAFNGSYSGRDHQMRHFPYTSGIDRLLQDLFTGLRGGQCPVIHIKSSHGALSLKLPRVSSLPFLPASIPECSELSLRSSRLSISSFRQGPGSGAYSVGDGVLLASSERRLTHQYLRDELGMETDEPLGVSKHATLVFLEDREELVKQWSSPGQLQTTTTPQIARLKSSPIAKALVYFLRNFSYRRTLAQLTQRPDTYATKDGAESNTRQTTIAPLTPGLTLRDTQAMTCLLIRAGVARITLPLHASNIYIVSPTAPIRGIEQQCVAWHERFASRASNADLPSLYQILHALSTNVGTNEQNPSQTSERGVTGRVSTHLRPWAALIPGKEQKRVYMDMLEWLVARSWVLQVRTFAFVWISSAVKYAVKEKGRRNVGPSPSGKTVDQYDDDYATHSRPHRSLLSMLRDPSRPSSAAGSIDTVPTVVHAPGSTGSRQSSREGISPETAKEDLHEAPSLIVSPHDASGLEREWINHVGEHLKDPEARRWWPTIVNYFDGAHAVEELAAIVGTKRAVLAGVFRQLAAEGVVRSVRHW